MTGSIEYTMVDAAGAKLEAKFTPSRGDWGAVVAAPHPLYGGTFTNPVVAAASQGLADAGVATLAFNYRGTGESEGTATDSLEDAAVDYEAAFAALQSRVTGPYLAAGYSFGAGTALVTMRDDARARGLVLLSPPCGMLRAEDLTAFAGRILVVVGDGDEYAPIAQLQELLAVRPDAVCEVIPGADHFFHFGGLASIRQIVARHVKTWV
jgi:alpha/beta superfamily hydrolase